MNFENELNHLAVSAARLRETLPKGSPVVTVVTHTTRSGMSRSIRVVVGLPDGDVWDISHLVSEVLGWKMDNTHGGVKVKGAGMNMGFHLTYILSQALHGDGYALQHRAL